MFDNLPYITPKKKQCYEMNKTGTTLTVILSALRQGKTKWAEDYIVKILQRQLTGQND